VGASTSDGEGTIGKKGQAGRSKGEKVPAAREKHHSMATLIATRDIKRGLRFFRKKEIMQFRSLQGE